MTKNINELESYLEQIGTRTNYDFTIDKIYSK